MKITIAALTVVAVLVGAIVPFGTASSNEGVQRQGYEVKNRYIKKKHKKRHYRQYSNHDYDRPTQTDQPQYWAEKLPFGSQIWWDQMEREGRLGRRQ